jgi:hypothetical protein
MTQREFNEKPLLLTPADMREITGLDDKGLKALRESNPAIVLRRPKKPGAGRFLYRKPEVAKLVGLQYQ